MILLQLVKAVAIAGIIGVPVDSLAAAKIDIGKSQYQASCAVCHGINGKGG